MRISRAVRRWLIVIGVALILSAVIAGYVWFRKDTPDPVISPPVWTGGMSDPQEDDQGWYCGTHGDRVCGLSKRAV